MRITIQLVGRLRATPLAVCALEWPVEIEPPITRESLKVWLDENEHHFCEIFDFSAPGVAWATVYGPKLWKRCKEE